MTVPAFDASRYAADPLPPRLLAVAAAAVEMREADMAYGDNPTRETLLRRVSANIAFDAAARGVLP